MLRSSGKWMRATAVALAIATPAALMMTAGSGPAAAQSGPDGEVDLDTFYRELSPHGKWFEHPRWGEVWRPNVSNDWRPYTRGHWAWTDEHGWYWVAEEEWGWAPFHYGRWVFDDDEEEWLWIPGTEWAPAWVQWRESEDHIGWAPLPPDSAIDGGTLRLNATAYDSPRFSRYWVFVPPALMIAPGLYRHIVPVSRHSTMWRSTRHVSFHHRFDRGRIYHPGVDHRRVERWAGRSIPAITLRPVGSARDYGWRRMQSGTEVPVFRPRVVARTDVVRPDRPFLGADRRDGGRPNRPDWQRPGFDRNRDGRPDVRAPGAPGGPGFPGAPGFPGGQRGDGPRGDWNRQPPGGGGKPIVINPGSNTPSPAPGSFGAGRPVIQNPGPAPSGAAPGSFGGGGNRPNDWRAPGGGAGSPGFKPNPAPAATPAAAQPTPAVPPRATPPAAPAAVATPATPPQPKAGGGGGGGGGGRGKGGEGRDGEGRGGKGGDGKGGEGRTKGDRNN